MSSSLRFNRLELAGSLGDIGTLLPIAMAMILVNGLSPLGLFLSLGIFYILSGLYYRVTVPVQPMKVIGAYAVATAVSAEQILASALLMGIILLLVGLTGIINIIHRITPHSVIRGVQLSTGILLMAGGVKFILGTSRFQDLQGAAEPALLLQHLGPVPIGLIIGLLGGVLTLWLMNSTKYPAGLVVVGGGLLLGLLLGAGTRLAGVQAGLYAPKLLPLGFPALPDFSFALLVLVLPQLPMTMGNACLAYTDLSHQYFPETISRVTNTRACISMAFGNFLSFILGGMPLCHGAGGLAAHYRFGARTAASNLMVGTLCIALALIFGQHLLKVLTCIPLSVLGILLIFAGAQLALTIQDLQQRQDLFVALLILGVTLASNLAAGFLLGIGTAWLLSWKRIEV